MRQNDDVYSSYYAIHFFFNVKKKIKFENVSSRRGERSEKISRRRVESCSRMRGVYVR